MSSKPPPPPVSAREKRLAEALRANLRRRKIVAEPRPSDIAGSKPDNGQDSDGGTNEGG
jgi:hypothetical protein